MTVDLTLAATNFDTVAAAYTGTPYAPFTQIACNDDSLGTKSKYTVAVTPGTTIWLQTGGFLGASGTIGETISFACA
jgi:hypothetical protein